MSEEQPASPASDKLPPIPGSPTFTYASTTNPMSSYNLPLPPPPRSSHAVLTKSDLEASQTSYTELLDSAKAYRLALATLSTAASTFGSALEVCARLKEARSEALQPMGGVSNSFMISRGSCTADNLLAASGVHQLIANHHQILSETVYRSFEVPLLHELDGWRRRMEEEEVSYQRAVKERSREIRRMEKEGLKLHKLRKRDVARFRSHLVDLTTKLDDLTSLHGGHARNSLRDSQETSVKIVEASGSLVRAEVDIFEALARKGWNGGGLDELLEKGRDFFAYEDDNAEHNSNGAAVNKLFSILPQKSILAESDGARPGASRKNSVQPEQPEAYQSLVAAVAAVSTGKRGEDKDRDRDSSSIFSERTEGNFNKSRGVRPFSPPPTMSRIHSMADATTTPNIISDRVLSPPLLEGVSQGLRDEEGTGVGGESSRGRHRSGSGEDTVVCSSST